MRASASWVIVSKATGKAVLETFSSDVAQAINLEKYRVVPILDWLVSLTPKEDRCPGWDVPPEA